MKALVFFVVAIAVLLIFSLFMEYRQTIINKKWVEQCHSGGGFISKSPPTKIFFDEYHCYPLEGNTL